MPPTGQVHQDGKPACPVDQGADRRAVAGAGDRKQATSYWEMALSVLAFSDGAPLPAYTPPARPPFSLNADPGAELAFPGSAGAVLLRQLWLGCPGSRDRSWAGRAGRPAGEDLLGWQAAAGIGRGQPGAVRPISERTSCQSSRRPGTFDHVADASMALPFL